MKHEDLERANFIKSEMERLAEETIELHTTSFKRTLANKVGRIFGISCTWGYPDVDIVLTDEDRSALVDIRLKKLDELRAEFDSLGAKVVE